MRSLRLLAIAALLCTACGASAAAPGRSSAAPEIAAAASPAAAVSGPVQAPNASPTTAAQATATAQQPVTTQPTATAQSTATAQRTATPQLTPTPSVVATVARTVPPPTARTGAYTTLPPGSALPTEQQCASEIARDPWEPRPDNRAANQSNAWASGFRLRGSYLASIAPSYEQRVTGNFTGTTDQILRWGACKWGFDENDVRAQAAIESNWRQSTLGDCNRTTQPETNGCASVGLLQIKGANIPATHPGTWPAAMTSTAFNVDYALAARRLCYEGKETWMRQSYPAYAAGDLWGCIGKWFSGRWHDTGAESYIARVRSTLNARTWLSSSF